MSYLVCATQRCGSTLLCEALRATNAAGQPREYFEADQLTGLPRQPWEYAAGVADPAAVRIVENRAQLGDAPHPLWDAHDYEAYFAWALAQGTTANGVFGAKVMWSHLYDLRHLLRTIPAFSGVTEGTLLDVAFGEPRYVWVRRRDVVRQAVSLWRAVQTARWRGDAEEQHAEYEPVYSRAAIDHLAAFLTQGDRGWEGWFAERDTEPLELHYEDVAADLPGAVDTVLDHLGLPPADPPAQAPLERQADARSQAWVETYAEETGQTKSSLF